MGAYDDKLTEFTDVLRCELACERCDAGIQVSGDTFAEIDSKLDAAGFERGKGEDRRLCLECGKR